MTKSLAPAIKELESAYDQLLPVLEEAIKPRNRYWMNRDDDKNDEEVPKPVITIQAQKRRANAKPVYGWYRAGTWSSESEDAIGILAGTVRAGEHVTSDEINITPDSLNRTKIEILTTLTKQMIHHYARHRYYSTVNENNYHNQWFQSLAERVGFDVEVDGSHGWSKLTPRAQLTKTFEDVKLDDGAFDMCRDTETATVFKGSKLKKWACDCTNVRVATYFEATCDHCGKQFEYKDKDKEDMQPGLDRQAGYHQKYNQNCKKYH